MSEIKEPPDQPLTSLPSKSTSAIPEKKKSKRKEAALQFLSNLTFSAKSKTPQSPSTNLSTPIATSTITPNKKQPNSFHNANQVDGNPTKHFTNKPTSSSHSDILENGFLHNRKMSSEEDIQPSQVNSSSPAAIHQHNSIATQRSMSNEQLKHHLQPKLADNTDIKDTTRTNNVEVELISKDAVEPILFSLQSSHSLREEIAMDFLTNIPLKPAVKDVVEVEGESSENYPVGSGISQSAINSVGIPNSGVLPTPDWLQLGSGGGASATIMFGGAAVSPTGGPFVPFAYNSMIGAPSNNLSSQPPVSGSFDQPQPFIFPPHQNNKFVPLSRTDTKASDIIEPGASFSSRRFSLYHKNSQTLFLESFGSQSYLFPLQPRPLTGAEYRHQKSTLNNVNFYRIIYVTKNNLPFASSSIIKYQDHRIRAHHKKYVQYLEKINSLTALKRKKAESYAMFLNSSQGFGKESIEGDYSPFFLDDPELKTGKHRTVITLPSYIGSIIHYIRPYELKKELNERFRQSHSTIHVSMTLSKIRSLKQALVDILIEQDLEITTAAYAFVYFEKLVLKNLVCKQNRKIVGGICLLLACKINEKRNRHFSTILESVQTHLEVSPATIREHEFSIYAALEFNLYLPRHEFMGHVERILSALNFKNLTDYVGEDMFYAS